MTASRSSVSIILATHNGGRFLREQLRSIRAQSHGNWQVILSDDGSSDDTLDIARDCLPAHRLRILKGCQRGLALNFWNGLQQVEAGHYAAFCDQDDVWLEGKLARALSYLEAIKGPSLYTAGRYITDAKLNLLRAQPRRPVGGYTGLLFRNRIAGHTCLISPDAVALLKCFPPSKEVAFHDWWAGLILHRLGARFVHDPTPALYYRQHDRNVIGARGKRAKLVFSGQYLRWIVANHRALRAYRVCLPRQAGLSHVAR